MKTAVGSCGLYALNLVFLVLLHIELRPIGAALSRCCDALVQTPCVLLYCTGACDNTPPVRILEKQLEQALAGSPWHYKVRRSGRAKRIRLSYSASSGLELVLPTRAALKDGLAFLATQQDWVESIAERHQVDLRLPPAAPAIPRTIELKAIGESYRVERGSKLGLVECEGYLQLKAPAEHAPLLLQQWMQHKAKHALLPWLEECSIRTGLIYQRASVRNQSSRWGSYSSRGSVSLNCRLLLLEPAEAEYVLLHELCHSKYMNHSADFWHLLESVCANARHLDRRVDLAAKSVPDWICFKP